MNKRPSQKERTEAYLARLQGIPEELKQVKRWAIYRKEGKRKVPRSPKATSYWYRFLSAIEKPIFADGSEGAWQDSPHWLTYEEAVEAWTVHGLSYHGVGFLLAEDDPIHVTDVDNIVQIRERGDEETEALFDREVFGKQNTYVEVSPSGTGVHVIGKARKTNGMGSKFSIGSVEVESYDRDRFVTFTGKYVDPWGPPTIEDVQPWVDEYVPMQKGEVAHSAPEPLGESDSVVLERTFDSPKGRHYRQLYGGEWEAVDRYPSRSEAEEVLIRALAFYSGGATEQIKRIMLSSRLPREKWKENKGYLERSIDKALDYCNRMPEKRGLTPYYDPEYSSKSRYMPVLLALWAREGDFHTKAMLMAMICKLNERWLCYPAGSPFKVGKETHTITEDSIITFASHRYIALWSGKGDAGNVSRMIKTICQAGTIQLLVKGTANKASCYLVPLSNLPEEESAPSIQHGRGTQGIYTPPTPEFLYHVVDNEAPEANDYLKIIWTPSGDRERPGLNSPRKVLLQQILYGGMTKTSDLLEFFRTRVLPGKGLDDSTFQGEYLQPLVDLGLLLIEEDEIRPTDNFQENMERLYTESGGERAFEEAKKRFRAQRKKFAEEGANPNDEEEEHRRIEAVLADELPWEELGEWEREKAEEIRDYKFILSLSGRSG